MRRTIWASILSLWVVGVPLLAGDNAELTGGGLRLEIDLDRGGTIAGLWYDLDGDGAFSADELMVDTGPDQGLILEVLEIPPKPNRGRSWGNQQQVIPSSYAVAGSVPAPGESWYQGEPYRLRAVADSIQAGSGNNLTVFGRFFGAGIWPYRLGWEISAEGAVRADFQLLPTGLQPRPSFILELGADLRFHYRDKNSFHRRAIHAGVDKRVWELPAEVVRWWSGLEVYDRLPDVYGYRRHEEIPWPDYEIVSLVQNGPADCRLWKAVDWDVGNLTHWRGVKSRGWLHVEDRLWGVGFGITDLAVRAPGTLSADMNTGDLTAALRLRFHPGQAGRLDPRGPAGDRLMDSWNFFLAPNGGRWDAGRATTLDRLGIPSGGITEVEPDPEEVKFSPPENLPKTARPGDGAIFRIDEPAGVDRTAWPVTTGVPFRQGEIGSVKELTLADSRGRPLPFQAEALAFWPDRSVKWALLDAQADLPAGLGGLYSLKKGAAAPLPETTVTATETLTGVRVDTGPLAFEIDRDGSGFIDRAWLDTDGDGNFGDGEMIVDFGDDRRNILDFVRSDTYRTGAYNIRGALDESEVRINELTIERSGPLRAVILIRGEHLNRINSPFTLRLEAFAGKPWIRAQHTFTYTMNPRGEFLKAAGLRLSLLTDAEAKITFGGDDSAVRLGDDLGYAGLTQTSLNRALAWGAENRHNYINESREAANPSGWADLSGERWGLTVTVGNFREEFAKGITVDRGNGTVAVWFHPPEAPPLDLRRYSRWMHPQVGETTAPWPGLGEWRNVGYATGLAKTSTAVFAFHVGPLDTDAAETISRSFQDRPIAVCNPAYYGDVGVAGPFGPYDPKTYPKLERTLTDVYDWFIYNRRRFSWYGLIDYGDTGHMCMPAIRYDDGQPYVFRDGWAYDIGRWGWTNTEGQDALGYLMGFFHTGYRPYFDAGSITAKHNQDVDVSHWGPFKLQGHTRHNVNHWGDGDFEIRISQPSPNRFHYYLTGDPRSRDIMEAVVDSLYLGYTVGHSADLGAIVYGFLVRWEMTGDPAWRDRALGVCHAYGEYIHDNGVLPHGGISIEASSGKRLNRIQDGQPSTNPFFLHGFGAIHAMVELEYLTQDPELREMLVKHAGFIATDAAPSDPYWLILAHALDRTGEKVFADRILVNLGHTLYQNGIYNRDRSLWTGSWRSSEGNARYRPAAGGGHVHGIKDIYTVRTGYSMSMMPALFRIMKEHGLKESRIPAKKSE